MKRFILTIDVVSDRLKPGVHVAQMLREAAAMVEYPVEILDHHHVYDHYGDQKYEWTFEDVEPPPPERRKRASRTEKV
jgi:hypothetical protein